jgi:hypothetical protein
MPASSPHVFKKALPCPHGEAPGEAGLEPRAMPITLPAFQPFQGASGQIPLKGNWNRPPFEGDRFISAEIDWITNTGGLTAVQFTVGGNSPVSLSQIVALYVDNRRCGSDISFYFPDTGFELVVPAHGQGLFPVFSNALTFYAIGLQAAASDITIVQICNSLPPPIALLTATQVAASATLTMVVNANATGVLVPAPASGTLTALSVIGFAQSGAALQGCILDVHDGSVTPVHYGWQADVTMAASTVLQINYQVPNINWRFQNGLFFEVASTTISTSGQVNITAYYTTP